MIVKGDGKVVISPKEQREAQALLNRMRPYDEWSQDAEAVRRALRMYKTAMEAYDAVRKPLEIIAFGGVTKK